MATQKVRKLTLGLVLLPGGLGGHLLGGSSFGVLRLKLPLAKARLQSAPEPVACRKLALASAHVPLEQPLPVRPKLVALGARDTGPAVKSESPD